MDDEIALLDDEMSRMEQRIAEARQALEQETSAKLAMASQLRHADRLATVGRLAAGVAHEFRTTPTEVRGQARLIMDHPEVPDSERQSAQTIVEQVDRMSRIIRQLLDLARRTRFCSGGGAPYTASSAKTCPATSSTLSASISGFRAWGLRNEVLRHRVRIACRDCES